MIADFLQFVDPRRYAGVARLLSCRPLTRWPRAGTLATIPPFKNCRTEEIIGSKREFIAGPGRLHDAAPCDC